MERFFKSVLEASVRARCAVIKIDLSKSDGDIKTINAWLNQTVKANLLQLLYDDGMPSYDELQGLYWREYQSRMKGQFKHLYETDKVAFKNKFGEFIDTQISSDIYSYILRRG